MPASDIFAKIGDIKGESLDRKHKVEIAVKSISWGVANTGSMAAGSGGGEGKAVFHDLTFTHFIDKASPVLMQACATGVHYKGGTYGTDVNLPVVTDEKNNPNFTGCTDRNA